MNEADQEILTKAVGTVIDEVLEDDLSVFGGMNRFLGLSQRSFTQFHRRWKRQDSCVFHGCNSRSVRFSHAIQKASLDLIAENGKVITPQGGFPGKGHKARLIGTNEASVFPGFCKTHEQEFADFESIVDLNSKRSAELQIYRIICRELVSKRHELMHFNEVVGKLENLTIEYVNKRLKEILPQDFLLRHPNKLVRKTEGLCGRLEIMRNWRDKISDDLKWFEEHFYEPCQPIVSGNRLRNLSWYHFTASDRLEVALAGRIPFTAEKDGDSESITVMVAVIPTISGTSFLIVCRATDQGYLHLMFPGFDSVDATGMDAGSLLKIVEAWMVVGTDQWFIRPSTWNALDSSVQQRVLDDHFGDEYREGFLLPYSIFWP
ncbi:MAG: hypothetical protein KKF30_12460 [Proteobacteria bacterium]|nr:hypothetical protein [Pseudomonadota bacterium]MBU4469493.1 hypothetical protein [Pseudomonadota bacterium]MCG2752392.1 hypothetical protein [Desulfobacteraceae bacterium]